MLKQYLKKLSIYLSIFTLSYLFFVFGIIIYFNAPNSYHSSDKGFVVERGMTFREVAEKLHQDKIIKNVNSFIYLSQLIKGIDLKVRYGEYFFEKNTSYYKIINKLVHGYIFFHKLTIAEGLSSHSALISINSASGLVGDISQKIPEGSILPETYFYSFNDSKEKTLKRMQDSMNKTINELWDIRDQSIPIKTKEQAIILASIVEKETGVSQERPQVASVFINRLQKGMKLQSDPTIIYSFTFGDKAKERPIKFSDIRNGSMFNTYHIYGLPPTPICNPGIASIKAVLNPLKTDYLYFVANVDGNGHHFSSTLEEHNEYVIKYRNSLSQNKQNVNNKKDITSDQDNKVPQ